MAVRLDCPAGTITALESGRQQATLEWVMAWCEGLGLSLGEFVREYRTHLGMGLPLAFGNRHEVGLAGKDLKKKCVPE